MINRELRLKRVKPEHAITKINKWFFPEDIKEYYHLNPDGSVDVIFPFEIKSLNVMLNAHWHVVYTNKKSLSLFLASIRLAFRPDKFRNIDKKVFSFLDFEIFRKRLLDKDNCYIKNAIDALKYNKFVFDDDPLHLDYSLHQYLITNENAKYKKPYFTVHIKYSEVDYGKDY